MGNFYKGGWIFKNKFPSDGKIKRGVIYVDEREDFAKMRCICDSKDVFLISKRRVSSDNGVSIKGDLIFNHIRGCAPCHFSINEGRGGHHAFI